MNLVDTARDPKVRGSGNFQTFQPQVPPSPEVNAQAAIDEAQRIVQAEAERAAAEAREAQKNYDRYTDQQERLAEEEHARLIAMAAQYTEQMRRDELAARNEQYV